MKTTKPKSPPEPDDIAMAVADIPSFPPTPTLEPEVEVPPPSPPTPPPVAAQAPAAGREWRFFKKVNPAFPLYVDTVRLQFEVLDGNVGVIKLDPQTDARKIEVLDTFAKARKAGVVEIDEETYVFQKKSRQLRTFAPKSLQPKLRVWESKARRVSPSVSANAAAVSGDIHSPAAAGSRGSSPAGVGGAVGTGIPAAFTPNLQRKSGVLKTPASGQFKEGVLPPFMAQPK